MKDYLYPSSVRIDSSGRKLDASGKLIKQTARKDLERTHGVDIKRDPQFKHTKGPQF